MKVNIVDLKKEVGKSLPVEFTEIIVLEEKTNASSEVYFKGTITNAGKSLLVQGKIETTVVLNCTRCLQNFKKAINLTVTEEYREVNSPREQERLKSLYEYNFYSGGSLDLTEMMRQNIILNLPMRALCSSNCQGICPQCGTNFNLNYCGCAEEEIDPRLSVLKKIYKSKI